MTIVGLEGTGARAVGTHMAVLENGDSAGSFSSGCVEGAIVAEASEAIRAGAPRIVRFGAGSPYIDIRLPCGGGMDILFLPEAPERAIDAALSLMEARTPVRLRLGVSGELEASPSDGRRSVRWDGTCFEIVHPARLRLLVAGHGAEPLAAARLAQGYGAAVELLSPDEDLVDEAAQLGIPATRLLSAAEPPRLPVDPATAILLLFHDHDWEGALLEQALETPAFWIGAMGSRSTHRRRCDALRDRGVRDELIGRIHGPVGLIPSSRDPATLALSALAEIAAAYQATLA